MSSWGIVLALLLAHPAQGEENERTALQDRARQIVQQNQENEITTTEARRRVGLLLRDLRAWAKTHGVELTLSSRTYSSPATAQGELLTVDRCALFHEDDLERLCPLDFSRSEVWAATVLFCRYLCAPDEP